MTKKATLTELKKQLRKKTPNELVEEIAHPYKKFSHVKEFYQTSFFNDDTTVLEKYKKIVSSEFLGSGRSIFPKMRIAVARKAVTDYKKVSCSNVGIADIMLSYVEGGVECTNAYGDIDEPFYNSLESMHASALEFMQKEDLLAEFTPRLRKVVDNTKDIGWGFHDGLVDLFDCYIEDKME
jgi:hypothetical protein